jgi:TRAP-type C4-dicarboxylate transport system substrate-binding protein
MTRLSRRHFTALAGLATIGAAVPLRYAKAAEFAFKLGTNVPEAHPLNVYARKAADEIKQETDGRFELKIFANNQLGGDTDMFSQLRSGALECFTLSGVNVLSTLIPSAAIWGVGFAWKDYPTLWNALDGKFGAYLRSQIDKTGLVVLDKIWDNGFRQTASPADHTPADFRSRVAFLSAPCGHRCSNRLALRRPDQFAEVYSALQTKSSAGRKTRQLYLCRKALKSEFCSRLTAMGWLVDLIQPACGQAVG